MFKKKHLPADYSNHVSYRLCRMSESASDYSTPVFEIERCDFGKVSGVVGDQDGFFCNGGSGYHHVHIADGSSRSFKFDGES